jgi:hypothetical protein
VARTLIVLIALLLAACGPATARPLRPSLAVGADARTIRTLTDLEEARDAVLLSGTTYVATDDGLLAYAGETPSRIGRAEGLPSDDVTALAIDGTNLLVATANGLSSYDGRAVSPISIPATARITDLAITSDGAAWVCSLSGLLRRDVAGAWSVVGDPFHCTTLAATPEGQLWAGSDAGLLYFATDAEGIVVREHGAASGIPERFVRSIVPVLPGQILTLLGGANRSVLGFFDGTAWHGYTLPSDATSDGERVVGLVGSESEGTFLVTNNHVFLVAPTGAGISFVPTAASRDANVRSFRATLTAAAEASAPEEVSGNVLVATQPLANPPASAPGSHGPGLVARALDLDVVGALRTLSGNGHAYVAIGSAGILELTRGGTAQPLRSGSLVHADDLQIAGGSDGEVWVRAADGDIGRFVDGRLRRLPLPEGIAPQSLATGRRGAYLTALVTPAAEGATGSLVRIFTSTEGGFRTLVERTLSLPATALPFSGVGPDGRVWIGVRIVRENGSGERMRGAVVIDPDSETVVYHHRGADHATDGGLPLPEEITGITFDDAGNAWFASLSGAVRVEEHQAITFDETRGVRGDVVTDVAAASGQMWIAAAEGLGSYADRRFDFVMPEIVMTHRPVALALDDQGHLWAGGRYGLLHNDGTTWSHIPVLSEEPSADDSAEGASPSLPISEIRDIEIDGAGRVWILGPDRILLLSR